MSKQSEAKLRQGYVPKLTPQACMHCVHFKMDITNEPYPRETNKRCGIGGFAVMKMGTCNEWAGKPE